MLDEDLRSCDVVIFDEKQREYWQDTFCMVTELTSQWTTEQQL